MLPARFFSIFLPFLATSVLAQTLPGQAAQSYKDGYFTEPNQRHTNYTEGQIIDISWNSTTFTNVNIYLITQFDFGKSRILATNILNGQFRWTVSLAQSNTPNNASQIYVLRSANNLGTDAEQRTGGFLSSSFYINKSPDSSSSASPTTSATPTPSNTVSAVAPGVSPTKSGAPSTPSPSQTAAAGHGLSSGAIAGIAVGCALGGIGIACLAVFFFMQRRFAKANAAAAGTGTPAPLVEQAYYPQPQELSPLPVYAGKYQAVPQTPLAEAPHPDPQEMPTERDHR